MDSVTAGRQGPYISPSAAAVRAAWLAARPWHALSLAVRAAVVVGLLVGCVLGAAVVLLRPLSEAQRQLPLNGGTAAASTSAALHGIHAEQGNRHSREHMDNGDCGADAMKTHLFAVAVSGDGSGSVHTHMPAHVYGSCNLCGLTPAGIAAALAMPHNCQSEVYDGARWVQLKTIWQRERKEEACCILVCSSLVPCSSSSSELSSGLMPNSHAPFHPCLLSLWVRPGTSDAEVVGQVFFDLGDASISSLRMPSPQQLPIRTILDAGANIGIMSVYFATLYPGATIVSLEPSSANFEVLVLNTARFPNVRPLERALWSSATTLCLVHGQRGMQVKPEFSYQVLERYMVPAGRKILATMRSLSVADVLRMFHIPSFDLLKVDVEGSEGQVFAASSDVSFLQHGRIAIMELHDDMWQGASAIVHEAFGKFPQWQRAVAKGEHELWLAAIADEAQEK